MEPVVQQNKSYQDVIAGKSVLRRGDQGEAVTELQNLINKFCTDHGLKDSNAKPRQIKVDGKFGAETEAALKTIQLLAGFNVDTQAQRAGQPTYNVKGNGVFDAKTLEVINKFDCHYATLPSKLNGAVLPSQPETAVAQAPAAPLPTVQQIIDEVNNTPLELPKELQSPGEQVFRSVLKGEKTIARKENTPEDKYTISDCKILLDLYEHRDNLKKVTGYGNYDGDYTRHLERDLKRFQKDMEVEPSGKIDQATAQKLVEFIGQDQERVRTLGLIKYAWMTRKDEYLEGVKTQRPSSFDNV